MEMLHTVPSGGEHPQDQVIAGDGFQMDKSSSRSVPMTSWKSHPLKCR